MSRQIPALQAKQAVEMAMQQWGMPQRMRFDNGQPFGVTADRSLPSALAIWLVSLGIDLIFNRPRTPQQNGSVECTQRISSRWANCSKCPDPQSLQKALDRVAYEHIHVFRQRAKQDQTRAEQYSTLFDNPRKYEPDKVDPNKVSNYLTQFRWQRTVYPNGRISIFSQQYRIGCQFAKQQVMVGFDPQSNHWVVHLSNGKTIEKLPGPDLSIKAIQNLTVFQRT